MYFQLLGSNNRFVLDKISLVVEYYCLMKRILFVFSLLLLVLDGFGQQILRWPGDANNNGVVNHFDLLHVARAFGQMGSPDSTINGFFADTIQAWQGVFPSGLNMGYADCDGNGVVNELDTSQIYQFWGMTHQPVTPDTTLQGLVAGPGIQFSIGTDTVPEGSLVTLPIVVGSPNNGVINLHGLAFSLNYDTAFVVESSFTFTPNPQWLGQGLGILRPLMYIANHSSAQLRYDISLSRTDTMDVSGWGEIGYVSFFMEDNLIGSPIGNSTDITIDQIQAVGYDQQYVPLASQTSTFHLINSVQRIHQSELKIYPNPTRNYIDIEISDALIEKVELFNMLGQKWDLTVSPRGKVELPAFSSGLYLISVETNRGMVLKKLEINR